MPLYERKSAVLAKIETTYGTDSVPTGAANAILVENLSVTPLKQDLVERKGIQPFMGNRQSLAVGAAVEVNFDVEIAGSGTAGTAPGYAPLLRMCGMAETLVVSTSAAYSPVSAGFEAGTIYFHADGILHKALGCRGSVSLKISAKGIPVYSFKFTGLYSPVTDVALPTQTLTAFQTPLPCNNTNTTGFAVHGYAGVLSDFNADLGNQVVHRQVIGSESVLITDRNVTGKLTIEAVLVATKDFFAIAKACTLSTFTLTHGTVGGNKVKIDGTKVQLMNPSYSEQDGVKMLNLDLKFVPGATGNDDITITCL